MSEMDERMRMLVDYATMHDEELHPDLVPYLQETGLGMPMLNHPLVQDLLPNNGMANLKYAAKQEQLTKAIAAEDWHTVVFLHERPYRCEALIDYVLGRDGHTGEVLPLSRDASQEVRDLVTDVWTDSENIHQHVEDWLTITSDWLPGDPLLLGSAEERAEFDRLPEVLTLWRGDCDDGGWSWSLERSVGEFFAKRWSANHALLTGAVNKRDVFGFITRRNEAEVMVRREHVMNIETTVVSGNEEDCHHG